MLLSICMPTYGRHKRVEVALERYLKIIESNHLEGKVEVCISDNTPTNETRQVVERLARGARARIHYSQNRENLGYDKNVWLALGMAKGEYIHLVSDEDVYVGEKLLKFIGYLEGGKPDCVILSHHMRKRLKLASETERWNGCGEREMLRRMLSLPGKGSIFLGLINCMIIRSAHFRLLSEKLGGSPGPFYGTGYMPVPVFLFSLSQSKNAIATYENFRENENVSDTVTPLTVVLPHNILRLMHDRYFRTMGETRRTGIIGEGEYRLFLGRFFWFCAANILEVRTYLCPEAYKADGRECAKYALLLADDYALSGWKRALFCAYVEAVYNPFIPYHLVYALWAWHMTKIRKRKDILDIHDAYRRMLSGQAKFESLDRDPAWKKA